MNEVAELQEQLKQLQNQSVASSMIMESSMVRELD